jgi:hypothetical protein
MPDPEKSESTPNSSQSAAEKAGFIPPKSEPQKSEPSKSDSGKESAPATIVDNGRAESSGSISLSAAIDKIASDKAAAQARGGEPEKKSTEKKAAPSEKKDASKDTKEKTEDKKEADKKDDEGEGDIKVKDPISKPKKEDKPKEDDPDVSEKDLDEELKNPHKNEKSAQRFRKLYNSWKAADAKAAKSEAAQKEKDIKLAALEKEMAEIKAGKGATDAEIEKEREELAQYRRRDELENDPKIKETYDSRIRAADDSIIGVLKKYNVSQENIDKIQKHGGFEEYIRQAGPEAKKFLDAIELADSESIRSALTEKGLIKRARGEYIKAESGRAKEYFAQKAKEAEEAKKNASTSTQDEAKTEEVLGRWAENAYNKLDYFHLKEVPDDATAEEKKQIQAQNEAATELRGLLKSSLKPTTLQERVDVALAATLARRAVNQLNEANERVKALEAELKELKEADETTPRRGGQITSGNTDSGKKKSVPKSLSEALDRLEAGETV